jgi:hypothetical protein
MTKDLEKDQPLAKVHYLPGDIQILSAGTHVVCAVTGKRIHIEHLHYWDADLQEAYASAEIMMRRRQGLT